MTVSSKPDEQSAVIPESGAVESYSGAQSATAVRVVRFAVVLVVMGVIGVIAVQAGEFTPADAKVLLLVAPVLLLFFAFFMVMEDRSRRRIGYELTDEGVAVKTPREDFVLRYADIERILFFESALDGPHIMLDVAGGERYRLFAAGPRAFTASLSERTDAPIKHVTTIAGHLRANLHILLRIPVTIAFSLCLLRAHSRPSLEASLGVIVLAWPMGYIFYLGLGPRVTGMPRRHKRLSRVVLGFFFPLLFTLLGVLSGLDWYRSPARAINMSALAPSLQTARTLRFDKFSCTVSAGWKTASSRDSYGAWLALRSETGALTVVGAFPVSRVRYNGAPGEKDIEFETAASVATCGVSHARSAIHPRRETDLETIEAAPDVPEGWNGFLTRAILDTDDKSVTLWQASGDHVVTVTIERGSPDDPEIRKFLDSFSFADEITPQNITEEDVVRENM